MLAPFLSLYLIFFVAGGRGTETTPKVIPVLEIVYNVNAFKGLL